MIPLADVRAALRTALETAGFNYSDGGDKVPLGASIDPFVCDYHRNWEGVNGLVHAASAVKIYSDRADEASAVHRLDELMTNVPPIIEDAPGPWRALFVVSCQASSPVTVGDATYASADFVIECYV
jgi:hypothetical protein